jgi:Putative metallopeptidase
MQRPAFAGRFAFVRSARHDAMVMRGRGPTSVPIERDHGLSITRLACRLLVLLVLLFSSDQVSAQPDASQPLKSSELSAFQAKVDAAALALRESDPRFRSLSPVAAQRLVEFVSGNMLFVALHELGHAVITQMGLPVLGRMEDAADTFAAFMLLRMESDFSHRALVDAAEGWFLAARRGEKTGWRVAYYSEHGLNAQRAYQIVCLMVGSDAEKFRDLADETNLPEDRRHTCLGDYSNAVFSWNLLLEPHRRAADQPKTNIDVIYGSAEGKMAAIREMARSILLLETIAGHAMDQLAWPRPLTLEMQGCGFPNARWDIRTRQVILCYELGADFADLYSEFGDAH